MTLIKILPLQVLTLTLSFFCTVNGQNNAGGQYSIVGTFNGTSSGTIKMLSSDGNEIIDSAMIENGTFYMKGKITVPDRLLFTVLPGDWNFRAFVDAANIKLAVDTAGAQHQTSGTSKWALIWEIEETGSPFADIYTEYSKATNQQNYASLISSLRDKYKTVKGDAEASAIINNKMDSLKQLLLAKQKGWIESYINENPSSIAGVYIFNEYFQNYRYYPSSSQTTISYLDSILNGFRGVATTSKYYQQLVEVKTSLKSIQPQTFAPDFTLLQRDGTKFTLSSTRGKYTLIDFWASWCLPCRKAIPLWKQLYTKYKAKEFIIVGVSNDRKLNDWTKALKEEKMSWIQVIDKFPNESSPADVTGSFGVNALPFYVLLDKEGRVIVSSSNSNTVRQKIEEIFSR